MSCVKVFRNTFRNMSIQDLHWLQKLGYRDQPRKTLKFETVLTLNLVKNYQVSNRKCS